MTEPDVSSDDLMGAWLEGDRGAGERLLALLARPVSAICAAVCGRGPLAEEAVQDAWVRVLRSRRSFRPGSPVRPWAYQIARNAARDLLRRRRGAVPLDSVPEPATGETPVASLLAREAADRIVAELDHLPALHREVLVLRHGLGLSNDAVAGILNITKAALWTRVSRARAELRRRVRHDL